MRGSGKRLGDLQQSMNQTMADMEANAVSNRFKVGNNEINEHIRQLHSATIERSGSIIVEDLDKYEEFMNKYSKFWSADNMRLFLYGLGEEILPKELIKRTPKYLNNRTPLEITMSLSQLMVHYLRQENVTDEELQALIENAIVLEDISSDEEEVIN